MQPASDSWIGVLPKKWETKPLFAIFVERGETNDGYKTNNVLSVLKDVGVINYEDKGDIGNKKSEDIERYKIVYPGDIVVNSMNVIIGSVGISPEYGSLSPVYIVLKPRHDESIDVRYYGYVFASRDFQRWLTRIGYGILSHRMRIPFDNLKREMMPVPPREVQATIADFLEQETARGDDLVAKYQMLIKLLDEERVAFIRKAVTRGFSPSSPMVEADVEWIGQTPENWRVRRLRFLCNSIETGGTPDESAFNNSGIPWYTPGDFIEDISLDTCERFVARDAVARVFPEGSILVVGIGATLGKVGLADRECSANQQCNAIIPNGKVCAKYLAYALLASSEFTRSRASVSTLAILNQAKMKDLKMPVPPLEEQNGIVERIDAFVREQSEIIERCKAAIAAVKERRSALIMSAVTGQIDVTAYYENFRLEEASI